MDSIERLRTARVLLDNGSTSNYITQHLCEKLGLTKHDTSSTIVGINNQCSYSAESCVITIQSISGGYHVNLKCFVLPEITKLLPHNYIDITHLPLPSGIQLADPSFNIPSTVDILLGVEIFWEVITNNYIDLVEEKILMQKLWIDKCNWDDEVSYDIQIKFLNFINSLVALNSLRIPRWVCLDASVTYELHTFTDASERAYGSCVYVRSVDEQGRVCVRLLASKNKVAPLKPVTIPRLELCGALLGTRLCTKVLQSLTKTFNNSFLAAFLTRIRDCAATEGQVAVFQQGPGTGFHGSRPGQDSATALMGLGQDNRTSSWTRRGEQGR
ncbi:uncharacterized protein LOC126777330 [Nymphalis io]|uniref:uncharacterized protein LOC126777330 n=1 Tax=Inachis io TaxID=171585 RepID=UPI0021673459|nr:uncharacterized protein LOC126777330 [Nymphalis io]